MIQNNKRPGKIRAVHTITEKELYSRQVFTHEHSTCTRSKKMEDVFGAKTKTKLIKRLVFLSKYSI